MSLPNLPINPIPPKPLPRYFKPEDPNFIYEMKWDGFRGVLYIDGPQAYFISREGKRMKDFQELADRIREELKVESAVLDGEIVSLDHKGHPRIKLLQQGIGNILYMAFDLMWLNNTNLRGLPLEQRKIKLAALLPHTIWVQLVAPADPDQLLSIVFNSQKTDSKWEGLVIKRKNEPYRTSAQWFKLKP